MRINFKDVSDWHKHFCWTPTFVDNSLVWLEWVDRKYLFEGYEYRFTKERSNGRNG